MSEYSRAEYVELILSCSSWQEAQKIADRLLDKRLIACAEFIESKSKYHWHNKVEEAKEVTLFMQSLSHLFSDIEKEITKLHSYDTFVLRQIPLSQVSQKAKRWLKEEVKNG
ncbi:MAG TPA: divalent cation tolerance protein CutA [Patescibacteria group bacterium]|nr:divalent cation tolerance protein CutA [Patescibacteria group bacterium]